MSNTTPAGWFPDPEVPGQLRYWDGGVWTEHRAPVQRPQQPQAYATHVATTSTGDNQKNWLQRHPILSGVAALIVLFGIVGAATGGGDPEDGSPETSADTATDSDDSDDVAAEPVSEPSPEPEPVDTDGDGVNDAEDFKPEDPKIQTADDVDTDGDGVPDPSDAFPKDPKFSKDSDGDGYADSLDDFPQDPEFHQDSDGDAVADSDDAFPQDPSRAEITLAMENALEAAEDYLDYSAFSRQGLIDQLSSDYGSGFKVEDATWAVDQLGADWKAQAVQAAKDYLDYSSFSRQGLIDQLSSSYGSQFTVEEATYAVNQIGL